MIQSSYLSGMLIDNEESIIFAEGVLNRHHNEKTLNLDKIREK
ncbi:hypothetical protein [Companilactobacillus nodensis]|nr:hypothetical protein [Companilactobacillus nodensis]